MLTERSKVRRAPKRGHYDRESLNAVLDSHFVCQIAFVYDGSPVIIPTLYGRAGNDLYLHGAGSSRMIRALEEGIELCLNVTLTDGLVLARSAFHHSANYRSAVVFGRAEPVTDAEEKDRALRIISEQAIPGRWEEVRAPNAKELKATKVLKINVLEFSVKIRSGGPNDDAEDYALPVWAGVLPFRKGFEVPEPDEKMTENYPVPESVKKACGGE